MKPLTKQQCSVLALLRRGETTIAELKGITEEQLQAGTKTALEMVNKGHVEEAGDVLVGLLLYNPYREETWRALEILFRMNRAVELANMTAEVARVMAV